MSNEQVTHDLIAARTLLALHGWAWNAFRDKQGRICLVEAVWQVTSGSKSSRTHQALDALIDHVPDNGCSRLIADLDGLVEGVIYFNDCHALHVNEIYEVIDKTLADLGGLG